MQYVNLHWSPATEFIMSVSFEKGEQFLLT